MVTGAGGGIGSAISRRLAGEGAVVFVADGNEAAGTEVAAAIIGDGCSAEPPVFDLFPIWARDEDLPGILDYDLIASRATYLYSDAACRMLVEPGTYELMVGPSANDLPVGVELTAAGEGSGPRARGAWIRAELFDDYSNLALVPESPMAGTAVAPASPGESATAVYRGWQGRAPNGAAFRLSTTGACRIAV